ncbi:hypothetical protein ACPPVQ_11790 [Diaminobutyricibacter sp. McL0618]|uniref:hypothetical protein n=1 Tax=Leifsonia sp. McL0618 TaxID=3415677 RepID=UPI003CEB78C6
MTDTTLQKGAIETIRAVNSATAKIPEDWILAKDPEHNDYGYCDGTIDRGPNGSAYWSYGYAIDLEHVVPNEELLNLMTPGSKEWKLTSTEPNEQGGTATDYYFSDGRTRLHIMLNGENTSRPRVGVGAISTCIRNGDTGPNTFPTPNPADFAG